MSDQEWASTSAQESACMRNELVLCCRSRAPTIRLVAAQIGLSPRADVHQYLCRPSAVPAQV